MMRTDRRTAVAIGALTAVALALRLWHISFGLPEWYHPDEPIKAEKALAIAAGDLNPHYFWHPSFMLYATAAAVKLLPLCHLPVDAVHAAMAGRVVNAILGALTIPLTFLLGWAIAGRTGPPETAAPAGSDPTGLLSGERHDARERRCRASFVGLGAAALLAVAPLHVFCSHYLKEDTPLTFWAVAVAIVSVHIAHGGAIGDYVIAGLLCGAAAATKYTGVLTLALPLLAHGQRPARLARPVGILVLAAAAGFLLLTPFAVIDVVHFFRGVHHEGIRAISGAHYSVTPPWSYLWTFHLRYSLAPGLGWLPTIVGVAAVVWALRGTHSIARLVALVVTGAYLVFETSPYKPPPNQDRYLLVLLPFIAVLVLMLIDRVRRQAPRLAGLMVLAMLVEPAVRTISLLATAEPDTRQRALEWLRANVPPAARVALEGQLSTDTGVPVVAYAPHLAGPNVQYAFSLAQIDEPLGDFDYVVASSFIYDRFFRRDSREAEMRAFYTELFRRAPVAEFRPPLFSYGFHNPTIRIYRIWEREPATGGRR